MTFGNKIQRKICGPIINEIMENWWSKYNRPVQYVKTSTSKQDLLRAKGYNG